MSQVSDFVSSLNNLKETIQITIPSQTAKVDCVELSFQQQTHILSSTLNGYVETLKYINLLNSIVIENTKNSELLIIDKLPILLQLRSHSIGNLYITDEDEEIDLTPYLSNWTNTPTISEIIEINNLKIALRIPTIAEESEHIKRCIDNSVISTENVIYNEYIKFIDSVTINSTTINFKQIKLQDCYSVISALPAQVLKQFAKFIVGVTEFDNKLLTYNGVEIEIPPDFFAPT